MFASGKGGTGKTTVTLSIGSVLAERGKSVVLLDLDPQAALTEFAGEAPVTNPLKADPVEVHSMVLLRGGRPLAFAAEGDISDHIERAAAIGADYLLADMSPAWSDVPHRAMLSVVDLLVLVPKLDAGGLPGIRELVEVAAEHGIPHRIVPTFAKRWTLAWEVEASLRNQYGTRVTKSMVPEDVRAAEAVAAGLPISIYAPTSRASEALHALVAELI